MPDTRRKPIASDSHAALAGSVVLDGAARRSFGSVRDAIVSHLDDTERLLVVLWYAEGLSAAEIGEVLGMPAALVEATHAEVLGRLRGGLAGTRVA